MANDENSDDKQNFGSWRENLPKGGNQPSSGSFNEKKPVDGMGKFVSKEGFVIDEEGKQQTEERQEAPTPQTQTPPPSFREQENQTQSKPRYQDATVPPPPEQGAPSAQPPPEAKKGFPGWLKIIILIILAIIIAGGVYILFFYKSSLEISVNETGAKIILDNKTASSGMNKIKPGKYTLKIEKEGFVPYSKTVEVGYFKKTAISVVLKEMPKISTIYEREADYLAYNKEQDLYLFYIPQESAFFRINAEKLEQEKNAPLLTTPHYIKNLVDVIWNPDRLTAILKIKNDNTILADTPFYNPTIAQGELMTYLYDFGRYDLLHQETKFWGKGIGDITFTPKGDQIAYFFEPGTGEKSLVVANKDNSALNRIADLRNFISPTISWSPDLKNIVLVNKSSAYETNKIFVYSLIDKEMKSVTENGNNLDAIFDLSGDKIIYGTYSSDPDFSNYSLLSIMDKDGQNKKELKVRSNTLQTTINSSGNLILLSENEKNKYSPLSINLPGLSKTDYVFSGTITNPSSIEYIEAKNSIIFIDQKKAESLFLTSKEYE